MARQVDALVSATVVMVAALAIVPVVAAVPVVGAAVVSFRLAPPLQLCPF